MSLAAQEGNTTRKKGYLDYLSWVVERSASESQKTLPEQLVAYDLELQNPQNEDNWMMHYRRANIYKSLLLDNLWKEMEQEAFGNKQKRVYVEGAHMLGDYRHVTEEMRQLLFAYLRKEKVTVMSFYTPTYEELLEKYQQGASRAIELLKIEAAESEKSAGMIVHIYAEQSEIYEDLGLSKEARAIFRAALADPAMEKYRDQLYRCRRNVLGPELQYKSYYKDGYQRMEEMEGLFADTEEVISEPEKRQEVLKDRLEWLQKLRFEVWARNDRTAYQLCETLEKMQALTAEACQGQVPSHYSEAIAYAYQDTKDCKAYGEAMLHYLKGEADKAIEKLNNYLINNKELEFSFFYPPCDPIRARYVRLYATIYKEGKCKDEDLAGLNHVDKYRIYERADRSDLAKQEELNYEAAKQEIARQVPVAKPEAQVAKAPEASVPAAETQAQREVETQIPNLSSGKVAETQLPGTPIPVEKIKRDCLSWLWSCLGCTTPAPEGAHYIALRG